MYYDNKLGKSAAKGSLSAWGLEKSASNETQDKIPPAQAARLNIAQCGLAKEPLVNAAISLLGGEENQHFARLIEETSITRMAQCEVIDSVHNFQTDLSSIPWRDLQQIYLFPPQSYSGPPSPEGYVARLLSRDANPPIIARIENELHISHEQHGVALRNLRAHSPEIYQHVVLGFPRAALESAASLGPATMSLVRPIVEDHIMLLSVATAHLRIAEMRNLAKHPVGNRWAGQEQWPTLSSVSHAALIQPAHILDELLQLPVDHETTDTGAVQIARDHGVLSNDSSSDLILSIAEEVQRLLPEHNLTRTHIEHTTRLIANSIVPLNQLTKEDVSKAGWIRRCFTEEWIGVTASKGAVIVARSLVLQRNHIRECIAAVIGGEPLPTYQVDSKATVPSKKSLARLTEALRVAGSSDSRATYQLGSAENGNSRDLVRRTLPKIENGDVEDPMMKLRIDPAVFFRRSLDRTVDESVDAPQIRDQSDAR